ncbi:MAG: 50S ribosomal protein L9 [Nitrospirales bacterium]
MKVILQENVEGLGYLGDVLTVANGYGRNYLLPQKKAVLADERQVKLSQHVKRQIAQKAKKELEGLGEVGKKMSTISLTFEVKTGKDDKLFGSVTSKDIADQLEAQGVTVDRRNIQLSQPLKELGTFSVPIKLHRDVVPEISVMVVKKGGEEPVPEESTGKKEPTEEAAETE